MSKGIVVDHKETGVRYAISEHNFNKAIHKKVRDLRPGETVLGYKPKARSEASEGAPSPSSGTSTPDQASKSESDGSEPLASGQATQTEGSAPAGTKDAK